MSQQFLDAAGGVRDPQTYAIIGAAMEVHRELGPGFLENVYHEAMKIELTARGIPFESEVELPIFYKGQRLRCKYRADFVCYGEIIVETKARADLISSDRAQAINYLKSTRFRRSLLLNFGAPSLQYERIVLNY